MPCSSFATLQTLNKCLSSSVCIPSNSSPVEVASATDNRARCFHIENRYPPACGFNGGGIPDNCAMNSRIDLSVVKK
ncbi:hypothetical protein V9T40_004297 [Parthenolecanium corni]|uniref:Uncharacterized protein n=1 Tax=Parthenolecanium corni TaxID=536013 RepID=A0AAN9YA99_9HEMI